jgi:succinate-acetate transporter protein
VYNKFNEIHEEHDDHHYFNSKDDTNHGSSGNFYVIDAESLRKGNAIIEIKDKTANPAALGLLGFGLTTFLLNLHNAGVYQMNSMILGMGLFYGGFAQILAGIFDWKRGNMFGMIAFLSYGCFWISLCALMMIPKMGYGAAADPESMGWYLFIWGVFSTCMFVGTLKKSPWALVFVFFTVVILFFLLAAHNWTESKSTGKAAGIEGVICGISAIYTAFGEILNEVYGRTILPLGVRTPPKKK